MFEVAAVTMTGGLVPSQRSTSAPGAGILATCVAANTHTRLVLAAADEASVAKAIVSVAATISAACFDARVSYRASIVGLRSDRSFCRDRR
jgi:hypothetical protein